MGARSGLITSIVVAGAQLVSSLCWAETLTYEIQVEIRYDVVADGVTHADTPVWGMPAGAAGPSGTLDLVIDGAGNVGGASPLHPDIGVGMLHGQRLYALHNPTLQLKSGSWATPVAKIAALGGGIVELGDTFIGDIAGLSGIAGFIEDGNSGDFFSLSNGLGLDGKIEFSAAGPNGMSLTLQFKTTTAGAGTAWYTIALDGGDITYSNGTDSASVGITGVVAYNAWFDAGAGTFEIPNQILLNNYPADWRQWGRRIDDFSGTIGPTGTFAGSAHFVGIEFTSLTGSTTEGMFQDGNSVGFDAGNGLVSGDTFKAVMTDSTGLFDLVIDGTLLSQDVCEIDSDCDDGVDCTDDKCVGGRCAAVANDANCGEADPCSIAKCDLAAGCQNVLDTSLPACQSPPSPPPASGADNAGGCNLDENCANTPNPNQGEGNDELEQPQPGVEPRPSDESEVPLSNASAARPVGCGLLGMIGLATLHVGFAAMKIRRRQRGRR